MFQSACSPLNKAPVNRVTTLKKHSTAPDSLPTVSIRCDAGWMKTGHDVTAIRKVSAVSSKVNKDSKVNRASKDNRDNRDSKVSRDKVNRDSKVNRGIRKTDRMREVVVVRVAQMIVGADTALGMIGN